MAALAAIPAPTDVLIKTLRFIFPLVLLLNP
jgi:hypothetical protein